MKLRVTYQTIILSYLFILIATWSQPCCAQAENSFRIAFYNLENLFHPDNDSLKNDEDFTPEGSYNWSMYRYKEKCNHMAKAILSIGEWEPPAIVGVAEVENAQALDDLVQTDVLRKFEYKVVHYESPDRRGIDVGMMYRSDLFTEIYSQAIPIRLTDDSSFATRDILYVKGTFNNEDTVHLFFNHWPSRYGGQAQSEPKRIAAAKTLRKVTDSLYSSNPNSYLIISGDFNDEWNNKSLSKTLLDTTGENYLTNLMASMPLQQGSHRYRGVWSYLDQIIVSKNLLGSNYPQVMNYSAHTVQHPFLLKTDDRYPGYVPNRTFVGRTYQGGFSDHLPVYIDLIFKKL